MAMRPTRADHDENLIEHDVRAIERALADVPVLRTDKLAERCGAELWEPGHFRRALKRALEEGRIRRIGQDLYGLVLD